jgi:hypothetical protein
MGHGMLYMTYLTFLTNMTFFLLFFNKDFKYLPLFCRLNPGKGPVKAACIFRPACRQAGNYRD